MAHPMLYNVTTDGPLKNRKNSKKKSFAAWEIIQYQTFGKSINKWRMKTLQLPRIRGSMMSNTIPKEKVPFSAMWSPSLLPKPKDWPEQCQVVGTCRFGQNNENNKKFDPIVAGFGPLLDWLDSGPKPVFIGFGSMIIENRKELENIITQAAARVKCRIVVQSGWSKIDVSNCIKGQDLSCDIRGPLCFNVGSCPHDWLLPYCCAVIHHGGAGTTAAGLQHGLPTFVCPFFADQYLWADKVFEAGVGPRSCPVKDLDVNILVDTLKRLRNHELKANAEKMSVAMGKEDGIQGAMDHFMNFLPVDNMFCDVSMLLGEVRRARYFLPGSNLKVSVEIAALLDLRKDNPFLQPFLEWLNDIGVFKMRRYAVTKYHISGGIHNIYDGLYYGIVGLMFQLIIQAPYKLFHIPDKYSFRYGAFGFCCGCMVGPFSMVVKALYAILYFIDCVSLGVINGFSSNENQRDYICNYFQKDNSYVYRLAHVELEREKIETDGIEESRFLELLNAFEVAVEARRIFNICNPVDNEVHKIQEVKTKSLLVNAKRMTFCNKNNNKILDEVLSREEEGAISFSHFCKMLNEAVGDLITVSPNEKEGITQKNEKQSVSWDDYSTNFFQKKEKHSVSWDVYSSSHIIDDDPEQLPPVSKLVRIPVVKAMSNNLFQPRQLSVFSEPSNIPRLYPKATVDKWSSVLSTKDNMMPSSFDGNKSHPSPLYRPRGRTWSDGFANKIDQFSQVVAGGRVRSKSPKARFTNSLDERQRRLRTHSFSDDMDSGSIRKLQTVQQDDFYF